MTDIILKVENISKQYRLGTLGTGTISHDLNRWWHQIRGKEDPYLKIGEINDRSKKGTSEYVWALKDISFEVKRGEILGIIGKNGAGKSTLLKILSRVTGPTTGSIKTKGRIASLLEVGTGFHPEMTGRENVYLNGAILGMTKKEINAKIDEIIAFSGCERYIDTPTKRYSSGMTVRLAFAVAAFLEPDILVVDEVLAVGDAEFQKKAIGKMQDISNSDGRTVLFVSHNMAAVKSLCTRGLLIDNGTIDFEGAIDDVIDRYFSKENTQESKFEFINDNRSSILTKIQLINNKEVLVTGDKMLFVLNLHPKLLEKKISIHLGIYNSREDKIINLTNDYSTNYKTINHNVICCELDTLPLIEDDYYVNIAFLNQGKLIEYFSKALIFKVINGDFYKTKKLPDSAAAKIFVNQNWYYGE